MLHLLPYTQTKLHYPNGISGIGSGAFMVCTSLKKVKIPDNTEYIDAYIFYKCSNLEKAVLSKQLNSIPYMAFVDCVKLENASLPSGITEISNASFKNCKSLKIIKIPQNVSFIGSNSFYNAGTAFSVAPSNKSFASVSGVLYNAEKTVLLKVPAYKSGDYKTPGTVTKISSYVFNGCQELDKVTIGEEIKNIDKLKAAKLYMEKLEKITVNSKNNKFSSKNGVLMDVDGTKIILYPCAKKGSYKTSASVIKIDANAFSGAKKLTKLFIGKNITECNINLENLSLLNF